MKYDGESIVIFDDYLLLVFSFTLYIFKDNESGFSLILDIPSFPEFSNSCKC